jgi:hypothetical protein
MTDNFLDEMPDEDAERIHTEAHNLARVLMEVIDAVNTKQQGISPFAVVWATEMVCSAWRRVAIEAVKKSMTKMQAKALFATIRSEGSKCGRGLFLVLRKQGIFIDRDALAQLRDEQPTMPGGDA